MTDRNGYEIEPGAHWLFVGSTSDFPEGPEEVEIVDLQRDEVSVRFLEGRLAGKSEWHPPARLYAPIEHVEDVRREETRTRWSSISGSHWSGLPPPGKGDR